jgi:hypothetical protein
MQAEIAAPPHYCPAQLLRQTDPHERLKPHMQVDPGRYRRLGAASAGYHIWQVILSGAGVHYPHQPAQL